jgi:hypothetical protein
MFNIEISNKFYVFDQGYKESSIVNGIGGGDLIFPQSSTTEIIVD